MMNNIFVGEFAVKLALAIEYATEVHRDQLRKSDGRIYIIHPMRVATTLLAEGKCKDPNVIIAAILHDTIEDTTVTEEDIREMFGDEITKIVLEVSDDKSMSKVDRKKMQIIKCSKLSKEAQTVKLGDKYDNLSDLVLKPPEGWSPERCQGYFLWARTIVDQIKDANITIYNMIDDLLKGSFYRNGKRYDCIDRDMTLEDYYTLLS